MTAAQQRVILGVGTTIILLLLLAVGLHLARQAGLLAPPDHGGWQATLRRVP